MTTSDQINEIATALAKAQGQIEGAVKGKENPHFRSKYADLGAVWDACREHLAKNGISVLQPVGRLEDGTPCTFTRLLHSSGQWVQDGGTPLLLSKQDMQGLGSALTYSRRYGLMSMVGIAPEDDDAEAATGRGSKVTTHANGSKPFSAPAGYSEWLVDLQAVAENGTDALQSAWKQSRAECREHLTASGAGRWEALKQIAAAVTAKAQKPVAVTR